MADGKITTEERDTSRGEYIGRLPTPPRLNLGNVEAVRREMARVYRHAKFGQMPTQHATRLVYMLSQILKAFELTDIERRIEALENSPCIDSRSE